MALEEMMKGGCPSEVLSEEGTKVAYYNDVEENNSQVRGNRAGLKCQILGQVPKIFKNVFILSSLQVVGREEQ